MKFRGFTNRRCGEHVGRSAARAFCRDCGVWCYVLDPCPGCAPPPGVIRA